MDVSRFDKRRLFVACCALGFASFKVAQSSLYSTAMLTSETTTVLIAGLDFSIASAAFVVLTEAVIVALALLGRLPRLSMPVIAPSLVLAATAVLSYSGALSSVDPVVSLMALAFAQGTATVMLTLAWVEIMTQMEPTISMKTLASSMLLAAAVTLALQNSPSLVMLPCVVATLVASALLYRRAKGIAGNALASGKTMGGDEVAAGAEQKRDRTSLRPYLRGFVSIGEGLLSLLVLGCVVGIINGFMVVQHYDFDGSSLASAMGIAAASMAFSSSSLSTSSSPRTRRPPSKRRSDCMSGTCFTHTTILMASSVPHSWPLAHMRVTSPAHTTVRARGTLLCVRTFYAPSHRSFSRRSDRLVVGHA